MWCTNDSSLLSYSAIWPISMLAVYDEDTLLASLLSWKPAQQGLSHRFPGLYDVVAISPPYIRSGLCTGRRLNVSRRVFLKDQHLKWKHIQNISWFIQNKNFSVENTWAWHSSHIQVWYVTLSSAVVSQNWAPATVNHHIWLSFMSLG